MSTPDPDTRPAAGPETAAAAGPPGHESVQVDLGDRGYDILIGAGLIDRAGALIRPLLTVPHVAVITDDTVAGLYGERFAAALAAAGVRSDSIVLPAGEGAKSLDHLGRVLDWLLGLGIERASLVAALGGGVVGDLAGFAAAVALRGIPFVQVPTTLLAQVDSAVGGKTGINSRHGKNLIGAFHQPRLVLADTGSLDSLPPRDLRAGYAEVVKYGLIDRPDFFAWLEEGGAAALLAGDPAARRRAIRASCESKAAIVAADERESGRRALLNLGHTFGHALEAAAGYTDALRHGEAVAIGLVLAYGLSARLGLCPAVDAERVRRHVEAAGLPAALPAWAPDAESLLALMGKDKKVAGGRLTFILARGIGHAFIARDVLPEAVRAFLADCPRA